MNLLHGPTPSFVADAGFGILVFAVVGAAMYAVPVAARRSDVDEAVAARWRRLVAYGLLVWLAVTKLLSSSGLLSRFDIVPPPFMVLVAVTWIMTTAIAFSPLGTLLARGLPVAALVGFQAFRLPLELILHQLFVDGVLPAQMTYAGMNFDIVTGITAIVVAAWAALGTLPRIVLQLWNIMGLVLLAVIVTIAITSAPGPLRVFPNEPANTIVTTSPFVWLPTVLVQAAWLGHLLVLRRLRLSKHEGPAS